jgi:hypothetical protein
MSKTHVRAVFNFLAAVCADKKTSRGSAMKVAFAISQHINWETGEAFLSLDTLAKECGIWPTSVALAVENLADCGLLEFERGSQGSGHSHRYRLPEKYYPAAASLPNPTDRSAGSVQYGAPPRIGYRRRQSSGRFDRKVEQP